jgi:hypothetical protein
MGHDGIYELVRTIDSGIAKHRLYLLMDEDRLRLIVGDEQDETRREQLLSDFASKHGWSVTKANTGVVFRLSDS